jgi:glycosyltransferase involved in cell wall biosynthesis
MELTMVGDGRHRAELESLAQSCGVSRVTRFLGELPAGEAIREQLDQATLMVLPSRTEGLPRVIIEAMARAVPCVASDVGGIPELLDSRYLVRPNDPIALADRIQEVISTPGLLLHASEQNWKNAQQFLPEILERKREMFYRFLRERTEAWLNSPLARASKFENSQLLTR